MIWPPLTQEYRQSKDAGLQQQERDERPAPQASVEHEELDEAENQTDREAERDHSLW